MAFVIFYMFYSNNFFMRRRMKELGIYALLGYQKSAILKLLTFENSFICVAGLIAGIAAGGLLHKGLTAGITALLGLSIDGGKIPFINPDAVSPSTKVHSAYQREIQDIPLLDKQMLLLLFTRKLFCRNPDCAHKTFSERFDFVAPDGKKTKRLVERILITSVKMSSVSASYLLKTEAVQVSKSSICDLLKKNAGDCG